MDALVPFSFPWPNFIVYHLVSPRLVRAISIATSFVLQLIVFVEGTAWSSHSHFQFPFEQGLRGALNAMLFRTGDQSKDFAVVLATNRPSDLDAAVIDRMDEAIEFPLPGQPERQKILKMYIDSYIAKAGTAEGESMTLWSTHLRTSDRGQRSVEA